MFSSGSMSNSTGSSLGTFPGTDYATVKYNSSGVQKWVNRYTGAGKGNSATGIVYSNNAVVVTGLSIELVGGGNAVTQKINATTGTQIWVSSYNGITNGTDGGRAITCDATGNIYVAGSTEQIQRSQSILQMTTTSADKNGMD